MAKRKLKKGECKDIEEITIQFENCECYTFTREEIANVCFHSIRKNISLCLNAVIEDYEAEDVWFVLPEKFANRKEKTFGFGEEQSIADRLRVNEQKQSRDITHFYIKYNTGEEECVSCIWEGDSDFDNPAQKAYFEEGYLCISISKDNL